MGANVACYGRIRKLCGVRDVQVRVETAEVNVEDVALALALVARSDQLGDLSELHRRRRRKTAAGREGKWTLGRPSLLRDDLSLR